MTDDSTSPSGPKFAACHDEPEAAHFFSGNPLRNTARPSIGDPNIAGLVAQLTGVERRLKSTLSRLQRITRKISQSSSRARSAPAEAEAVLEIMINGVCHARVELPATARFSGSPADLTGKIQPL